MLKTALFDCAIDEKCFSVEGGRGICCLFSPRPGGFDSSKVSTPGICHVHRHGRSARIVAEQLRFNHQMSFKIHHERSAVIMMGLVIGVFLVCYGMYLRCSFTILFHTTSCNDENYKIPFLVLNSAINPLIYAFFKRDTKKEFKRLVGAVF